MDYMSVLSSLTSCCSANAFSTSVDSGCATSAGIGYAYASPIAANSIQSKFLYLDADYGSVGPAMVQGSATSAVTCLSTIAYSGFASDASSVVAALALVLNLTLKRKVKCYFGNEASHKKAT
ncbi:hypothetical protein ACH5RR_031575 [Cinchona calisaya]|uniref:Uncharacterized protein n=1 Tax=Cinchona calisaya TaxID=153742 RepID=A0ABD2YKV9_9GENT